MAEAKKTKDFEWIKSDLLITEACLDRTWDLLNSGYWKDVPISYRYSYSLCSIIKVKYCLLIFTQNLTR